MPCRVVIIQLQVLKCFLPQSLIFVPIRLIRIPSLHATHSTTIHMRMHAPINILHTRTTHMRHLCHLHHRLPLLLTHLLPTNMRTHTIHLPV